VVDAHPAPQQREPAARHGAQLDGEAHVPGR
jgi:hypothetical protein